MENTFTAIEKLFQKVENYFEASLELLKYEAANKLVHAASYLAVVQVIASILIFCALFLNIGLALWIGKVLGETYYGFFVVASFYLLLALVFFVFRNILIKRPTSNFVIKKLKSENFL